MTTESINKGNPLENTKCPVTPARLWELYWKEGKTLTEIGVFCTGLISSDTVISPRRVLAWLDKAGIQTRNHSESRKLEWKKGKRASTSNEHLRRGKSTLNGGGDADHMKRITKKAHKAWSALSKSRRVVKTCAWKDCNNQFTRSPYYADKVCYCSRSCVSKNMQYRRSLDKLRTVKPNTEVDQATKEWAERILGRKVEAE